MEDPQHLLAHSQLLAQLQHGGASHHNPLVFVQGKPMPPPLQQHAASHAQPAVFLGGQNLVWAPKDPPVQNGPSPVPGQRLPQPSANANQAAMMQAMMHANQMQLGGGNSIATAAAAAAMATSQQTRATQAQVLSVANLMQQQQQAQQHRQQQFLAQNQQANAMQGGNWLSAMPQRGAAPGPFMLETGKPLLAAQPLSAADRTALQHRQLLLAAQQQQQQQQQQRPQQQQQQLVQQLHAVLAAQQAGQGIAPSQLNNMLSSLWSQQQQQQEAHQQAAMAAAQQQAVQQAQRKIRQNMAALAHLTPGQLQALANNQALSGHMNQGQMQSQSGAPGGNGGPAAMLLQAQSQAQTQALLQAHARAQQQAAVRANMQANAAKAAAGNAAAKASAQSYGPSADALLASHRLTEQRLKGHTQAAHAHRMSDNAGVNMQAAANPAATTAGLQLPPEPAAGQGNAAGGSPPSHAPLSSLSQEQRRSALVCVAMQLVQNNITVDQAIHSGIMGGLSVTDVKYIIEVHDAHLARVKQSQQQQQAQHMHAELAAVRAADQLLAAGAHAHGNMRAQPMPTPTAADAHAQATRASGSASPALSVCSAAESDGSAFAKGAFALGGAGSGSAPPSVAGGPPARAGVSAEESFDAFSYGFFGGPATGGDMLQELESADVDGVLDGNSGDIPSWLSEGALPDAGSWHEVMTASADAELAEAAARGPAAPEHPQHDSNDVAARLANLDLGYGFF